MDDQEAQTIFRNLSGSLAEHGFQWIVQEVNDQIAVGRLEQRKVKVAKLVEDENSEQMLIENVQAIPYQRYVDGNKAQFWAATPFSPQEQLRILLDAIERVFIDSARIEQDTHSLISEEGFNIEQIRFIEPDSESATLTISYDHFARLDEFRGQLLEVLASLRQKV